MTLTELLSLTRSIIDDEVPDYKISDARLVFWLSEGQDQFCKETGFYTDKATYNITTAQGVDDYALNSRIIEVKNVYRPDGTPLTHFQMSDEFPVISGEGPPTHWQTDEATGRLRLVPTPDTDGDVYSLRVWRMAKIPLFHTGVNGAYDTDPELSDDLVGACAEWATYKALSVHDMELELQANANSHFAAFKMYVSNGRTAFTRISGALSGVAPAPEYIV